MNDLAQSPILAVIDTRHSDFEPSHFLDSYEVLGASVRVGEFSWDRLGPFLILGFRDLARSLKIPDLCSKNSQLYGYTLAPKTSQLF